MDSLNHKALKSFTLPDNLKHLPVYEWGDDHGESEWIEIGTDGSIWHMIGLHDAEKIEQAQVAER